MCSRGMGGVGVGVREVEQRRMGMQLLDRVGKRSVKSLNEALNYH